MTKHPLCILQEKLLLGDICKIDYTRIGISALCNSVSKFLGFEKCYSNCDEKYYPACINCYGKMKFQNLETAQISTKCYGYSSDVPIIILWRNNLLPDNLFEI